MRSLFAAHLLLATTALAETFNGRPLTLDASGKIIPWMKPQASAYGDTARQAFEYLVTMPSFDGGLPAYITNATFDPPGIGNDGASVHHPTGIFAMFTDSAQRYYGYSGDERAKALVRFVLDYLLDHGLTAPTDAWASVPYATGPVGGTEYQGFGHDGFGVLEPDKVGEIGVAFVQAFELTGDTRYRDAAVRCATALAANVRPGTRLQSPWPFRALAATNQQVKEDYCAHVIAPIRLFDELERLSLATPAMRSTRAAAWTWLMQYPMQNDLWESYFEDLTAGAVGENLNQYVPMETARYLLNHPELDPDWRAHVEHLIDFVERTFAVDATSPPERGQQWGANAISEQFIDMHKMGSHTARYASVVAGLYERVGGEAQREKAYRSLNWATYMNDGTGLITTSVDFTEGYWFSDSYGDFIRHFLEAMASVPEWAPPGDAHLLKSSSVVRQVTYAADSVRYVTADVAATEVLRLPRAVAEVRAGATELAARPDLDAEGYVQATLPGGDVVLRVRHVGSAEVTITLSPTPDGGVADAGVQPTTAPKGCGCAAAGSELAGAALAALALRRRRRS